jgi:hypothetical protein
MPHVGDASDKVQSELGDGAFLKLYGREDEGFLRGFNSETLLNELLFGPRVWTSSGGLCK